MYVEGKVRVLVQLKQGLEDKVEDVVFMFNFA